MGKTMQHAQIAPGRLLEQPMQAAVRNPGFWSENC
jgi:hypothetical protein